MTLTIRQAELRDLNQIHGLLAELYDEDDLQELKSYCRKSLLNPQEAFFLAMEGPKAHGVAHMSIRHDYVEGALEDQACAYLEAIFIRQEWRLKGLGRRLIDACRQWARDRGCHQLASDTMLDNEASLGFHLKTGFTEVGRLIHFIQTLNEEAEPDSRP